MKKNLYIPFYLGAISAVCPLLLDAQTYDLVHVERGKILTQTGTNTVQPPVSTPENGGLPSFYFYSRAEMSGSTPLSLSITNGGSTLYFIYDQADVLPLFPYFYDGFDVNEGSMDLNTQRGRQGGGDAPVDWLANVEDQSTDYHQQVIGPVLQLAGDGALPTALVSPDLNFTTLWNTVNLGGKRVQVVMDAYANREGTGYYSQAALTVAANAPLAAAGQPGSGFSVVFIEDDFGGTGNMIQIWDGDELLANNLPNPAGTESAFVEIYIDDPVDANPWDGVGSTVMVVRVEGTEIWRYEKQDGGYTSNYVTLEGSMQANGAQLATHIFEDFTVFWGTTNGSSLPVTTEVETQTSFASETDLGTAFPAGSLDLVSDAGTVATVAIGGISFPAARPVKEYDLLQFLDPTFDLTVSWDAYAKNPAASDAILTIHASYWDSETQQEVIIWEAGNTRGPLLPGIDPSTTFVTIPADTFTGSANGAYSIKIIYSNMMGLVTEGNTTKVWLESVDLQVPVQVQPDITTWAGYPLVNEIFADTGNFLGWLETSDSDRGWLYAYKLSKYIYIEEPWVTPTGSWIYIPKD